MVFIEDSGSVFDAQLKRLTAVSYKYKIKSNKGILRILDYYS
jgi:hypothetical protein